MSIRSDTWSPFAGPHGGAGWRNLATGEVRYGAAPVAVAMFAERPPSLRDIDQVEELLGRARRETVASIMRLGARALRRLLGGDINAALLANEFFTSEERTQLGEALLRLLTPAELLGRARIRLRQMHRSGPSEPTPFDVFRIQRFDEVSGVRPLAPEAAIDYFKGLLPILKLDPLDIAPPLERRAFTLAVTTDEVILRRVHAIILDRLETGKEVNQAPTVIQEILVRAGIAPKSSWYAESVVRTNMLEAYRNGAWREFQDPDLAVDFAVWRYLGIHDGRERHGTNPEAHAPAAAEKPDHLRWFGQHFSRDVSFVEVRGTVAADVIGCRCDFNPIYKADWAKLQSRGVATVDNWQQIKALDQYSEWVPYIGPKQGKGWLNTASGTIIYGDHRPGSHEHIAAQRDEGHSWDHISKATGIPVTTLRSRFKVGHGRESDKKTTQRQQSPAPPPAPAVQTAAHLQRFVGQTVGHAEHAHAYRLEASIAKAVGGKQLDDNEPLDVRIEDGDKEHAVEVKTMLKGGKTAISVHPDALMRKVAYAGRKPNATFHTVVIDERKTFDGGAHAESYSGHRIYYKRGSGRYTLSKMHPVESKEELNRLIRAGDDELPEAARGGLPTGAEVAHLERLAEQTHASRQARDNARKARLKAAGTSAYARQT